MLERQPADVVVAGEKTAAEHTVVFNTLFEHLPHLAIIQVKLSQRTLQLYMGQEMPASTEALFQGLQALSHRSSFPEIPQ